MLPAVDNLMESRTFRSGTQLESGTSGLQPFEDARPRKELGGSDLSPRRGTDAFLVKGAEAASLEIPEAERFQISTRGGPYVWTPVDAHWKRRPHRTLMLPIPSYPQHVPEPCPKVGDSARYTARFHPSTYVA